MGISSENSLNWNIYSLILPHGLLINAVRCNVQDTRKCQGILCARMRMETVWQEFEDIGAPNDFRDY
jgi:hypothetical protein